VANSTVAPVSVGRTVATSGKETPIQSDQRTKLDAHKSDLAAKALARFGNFKSPKEDADEFATFWESAIAETLDEIDKSLDFDSADSTYGSATIRVDNLQDGIVQLERVRATGRGRRGKGSVLETLKGIWYSGAGRYLPI
jgi:ABC-type uncharacterized transport system fused permease/ATPase subunit